MFYAGPDEDSPPTILNVNLTGPTAFDIADGPQTPDMIVGGNWYMDNDNDYYVLVSSTGSAPITKKGPGFLQFKGLTNTFSGDISIEDGTFHGLASLARAAPFGNAANNVYLTRNGIISFGGGGTGFTNTLANATFAGGNKWRCNLGAAMDINLTSLARVGGSRGTLTLTGTANNDHFDDRGRLYVAGWKTPNADPDENNMTAPCFVNAGWATDIGPANFCKVDNATGRINSFLSTDPGGTTTFPASPAGTEKVYLAAAASLATDKNIWALRTAFGVTESANTTITLGSGGLILNSDITIDPKVKFGASGDREAFVYVAGGDYPYMRTATLADQLITSGGLTKFGDGILVLTADSSSTLSGAHWVNNGTLRLANANVFAAAAEVNIERGAAIEMAGNYTLDYAFKGLGRILTGTNLLVATGSISPGFSVGTLTVEDLDFRGTYDWEYDGTNSDAIACTTLAFGGGSATLDCAYIGGGAAAQGVYPLFTYKGSAPALPAWTVNAPTGLSGEVSVDDANKRVILTLGPVPSGTIILFR